MNFGVTELIILLVIVALIFGTKRLRNMGSDLGNAVRGFRDAVKEDESKPKALDEQSSARTVEGEVTKKENSGSD